MSCDLGVGVPRSPADPALPAAAFCRGGATSPPQTRLPTEALVQFLFLHFHKGCVTRGVGRGRARMFSVAGVVLDGVGV